MNRRERKEELFRLLGAENRDELKAAVRKFPPQTLVNPLFSSLCITSEREFWNGIFLFGVIVPAIAEVNLEQARVIMRRFLWSLNDESGGIGWGAPEAMAEIMANEERLAHEYLHMLVSYMKDDGPELFQDGNYLELPMLQRGLLWGIGRLADVQRERLLKMGAADDVADYLDSDDAIVRGLAVWCLARLSVWEYTDRVAGLLGDDTTVPIQIEGRMVYQQVSDLARAYGDKREM